MLVRQNKKTVKILSIGASRSEQTVQTQEQSDQGLHCLQAYLHLLGALLSSSRILLNAVSCLSVLCHKTELNSTKVYAANAPATDA